MADFNNALGFIVEGQYRLTDKILVGVRATMIEYEIQGGGVKANSFGFNMAYQVGK